MERRELVAGAGVLLPVAAVYSTFYTELDKQKYRTLLTEDYLLFESAILRRGTGRWRLALLHSTRTTKPAG